ncbi:MAG: NAD-dependent epimerase/dehydratase family protein, partial [Polyangiaceae bacterium]
MKQRILVLGATGALGRPLCARLRSTGHDVYGTNRSPDGARV